LASGGRAFECQIILAPVLHNTAMARPLFRRRPARDGRKTPSASSSVNRMRIFPPEPVIGATEGFTPEKDIFGRAKIGAGLTNLINAVSGQLVVAIDGQWGSGKSTFLKMWAGSLRSLGHPVVYFDAFEHDYLEDAFSALASEIIGLSEAQKKSKQPEAKKFADATSAKSFASSRLTVSPLTASLSALRAMTFAAPLAFWTDLGKELSELEDKYIGELLTRPQQQKAVFEEFRTALAELPSILALSEDQAKPLVFIIDELDRCRPLFALEILERIKHFFNVPNVHFVLGVHLVQLQNSVVVAYGPHIDARTHTYRSSST
jgi:predicted KAP-like P-loop ATPase